MACGFAAFGPLAELVEVEDSRIQGFKDLKIQDLKIQGLKIQRFKDSKIQGFKDLRIQRFKDSTFNDFTKTDKTDKTFSDGCSGSRNCGLPSEMRGCALVASEQCFVGPASFGPKSQSVQLINERTAVQQ